MRVLARAPATSANLGPGFDVIGVALDLAYDEVEVELSGGEGVEIAVEGVESESIPTDPSRNTAGLVATSIMSRFNVKARVKIRVKKGVPQGVGLGSSAASAAATAAALSRALGLKLSSVELIEEAARGEVASSGVAHADNVAPSVLGGFAIVCSYSPLLVEKLMPPQNLEFALAIPLTVKKTTEKARSVLPKMIGLREHVDALASFSMLIMGIVKGDVQLIGRAMSLDKIVEAARAKIYPGFLKAKREALKAGAAGVTLSGAGPTAIAAVDTRTTDAKLIAEVMKEAYEGEGVQCVAATSRPRASGVEVL
ncbi:MAG: homoserine kinase [Thermoprotei archaeon]|nr:MAG: homoserine kinase [Thermoprotei archaeon]